MPRLREILRRWGGYRRLTWPYLRSAVAARARDAAFAQVERYAMFLGYPRSGHTLVGALLSAHPDMVIAHELDALRYVPYGFSRRQLFWLLLERDRWFAARGHEWTGYNYTVPGQWQGRYRTLRVVGDKKGGESSDRVSREPGLLDRVEALVKVPVLYLHVTRNPFDNITTMAKKQNDTLASQADRYFAFADANLAAQRRTPIGRWFEYRQEDIIAHPHAALRVMCDFLSVQPTDDYLDACAGIVFESPKKRRFDGHWSRGLIDSVQRRIDSYPFLQGYTFEG